MQGTYFRSDEHMTHYEVTNSVGSFMSEDFDGSQQSADNEQEKNDTTQAPPPPARQAATRHKATQKSSYTTP